MIRLEETTLYIGGPVLRSTVRELYEQMPRGRRRRIRRIDLAEVTELDSAGVAFLEHLRRGSSEPVEFANIADELATTMELFALPPAERITRQTSENPLVRLGGSLYDFGAYLAGFLLLAADIVFWTLIGVFSRSSRRRGEITKQAYQIGVAAVPIILVLSSIIGIILALQSADQLQQFGAGTFVVDLIGVSMSRELGPLMTAIIIAGRSGSAIAAQIATMKVTEELDALNVMALNPVRYVIVPMMLAMLLTIPVLTALSILVGIAGGLIVGVFYLDLTAQVFLSRLVDVLNTTDITIGVAKSLFFGTAIVTVASHFGMTAAGGSEGVGHATTQSVVVSIFGVIALDAVFSLLYLI